MLALSLAACGGSSSDSSEEANGSASNETTTVGPVKSVDLGPIEDQLAAEGKELFDVRCKTCHLLDGEHVGPALGDITERRDPAFIMNMILAPEEMVQNHPEARKLFSEYGVMMTNQNLSREEARALLEYFRQQAK
ncbi:c-type cytochrome [Longibacter salinarum]|uniref:c-type cytochrome n=1 Tax=Longibacter salinarum TaxID=1850348 RepID=UPI001FEC9C8F|nr:cytochrome c [Longibacter salinarum]